MNIALEKYMHIICLLECLFCGNHIVEASDAQHDLIRELFLNRNYDHLTRPVDDPSEKVIVHFNLTLNILVFVNDMDQVMKTNGYLDLAWSDKRLIWNPAEHGGIQVLRLPVEKVWQPDIALTNTVDGQFWPSYKSNALIYSDGNVQWVPPFIFKSGCDTNPYYFPFDRQVCNMVFRSVTYHANEVDFETEKNMMLKDYAEQPSGSWHVVAVPLKKQYRIENRKYGRIPIVTVQLDLKAARRTKFYVMTFLLPCVCIALLTIFIFYLPIASGEKLCIAISILFSIVVFLLILIEILPPSDSLPLMTKFLVFTFVCNLISSFFTTISVNWTFRSKKTHVMALWIRKIFLDRLPRYLRMQRPQKPVKKKLFENQPEAAFEPTTQIAQLGKKGRSVHFSSGKPSVDPGTTNADKFPLSAELPNYRSCFENTAYYAAVNSERTAILHELHELGHFFTQFPGYPSALENVAYIAKNLENQDADNDVTDDWKFAAMVVDRLLLWIFLMGNILGSLSILLDSPYLFEPLNASEAQHNLIRELFLVRRYDHLSRPVDHPSRKLIVHFSVTLNILVFVSDQGQVMKTNGYFHLTWTDMRLKWKPADYGNIETFRFPVQRVWQPDIALTNIVDGQFYPNYFSNVQISHDGTVQWAPPFIYKSTCETDPYYFPFDRQLCHMVFRSLTYTANEVDFEIDKEMILKDYFEQPSGSWDVTDVPLKKSYRAERRKYGTVPIVTVQLHMTVARKWDFYVVTFLLPCLCIALLTVLIFFVPIASGEKLCISVSILFSVVVFLLILTEILPPSESLPLMTRFLVFVFLCNLVSAFLTTVIVQWSYRSQKTDRMGTWTRKICLEFLPKILCLERPERKSKRTLFRSSNACQPAGKPNTVSLPVSASFDVPPRPRRVQFAGYHGSLERLRKRSQTVSSFYPTRSVRKRTRLPGEQMAVYLAEYFSYFHGFKDALESVAFIAKNCERGEHETEVIDDWKYAAMVADRLLLWIMLAGNIAGCLSILLDSPYIFAPVITPQQTAG
ncbi:uncharacterized protein LOC129591864 [Paramacrobiotus metropolitanus]|uniref:uncharacterized protein LOC129591864 n=1 Tax=Paramacrobiotus metropolitanus TaxID=2943436 RepID=UPI002446591A|nr:uncharacterized protein LOC129591864 [Paramacrobiotus metropolitanus]